MSAWVVIPCLLVLRDEFNAVSPARDKGADGTIGDTSHASTSDHSADEDSDALRARDADSVNEVHALDIDSTGSWPTSTWFDETVEAIRLEERRRWLDPNDKCRLKYIIWNKRIASQGSDFLWLPYSGVDPHTNHVHFSGRYETVCENDTRPWGVADMPLTDADVRKLWTQDGIIAAPVGTDATTNPEWAPASFLRDASALLREQRSAVSSLASQLSAASSQISTLAMAVAALDAKVSALETPVVTREAVRAAMLDIITGAASAE